MVLASLLHLLGVNIACAAALIHGVRKVLFWDFHKFLWPLNWHFPLVGPSSISGPLAGPLLPLFFSPPLLPPPLHGRLLLRRLGRPLLPRHCRLHHLPHSHCGILQVRLYCIVSCTSELVSKYVPGQCLWKRLAHHCNDNTSFWSLPWTPSGGVLHTPHLLCVRSIDQLWRSSKLELSCG